MDENEFSVINVIPFIDIMLVLLTIVLTTSTFIARGAIPLELPKSSPTRTETLKGNTIEIDKAGKMFLNGRLLSLADLKQELCSIDRSSPVLIRADRELVLQAFVDVMDSVKGLGFRKVSLQTESRS
jgi:biopolymer transport protein ExbD